MNMVYFKLSMILKQLTLGVSWPQIHYTFLFLQPMINHPPP